MTQRISDAIISNRKMGEEIEKIILNEYELKKLLEEQGLLSRKEIFGLEPFEIPDETNFNGIPIEVELETSK